VGCLHNRRAGEVLILARQYGEYTVFPLLCITIRPFLGDLVAAWDMLKTRLPGDILMYGFAIYEHNRQPFFGDMRAGGWKMCLGTDTMHF